MSNFNHVKASPIDIPTIMSNVIIYVWFYVRKLAISKNFFFNIGDLPLYIFIALIHRVTPYAERNLRDTVIILEYEG